MTRALSIVSLVAFCISASCASKKVPRKTPETHASTTVQQLPPKEDPSRWKGLRVVQDDPAVVEYVLKMGQLASLPESAKSVRSLDWSGLFTGASYLRFTADPADIDVFIAQSEGLAGVEPVIHGPDRMYLPRPLAGDPVWPDRDGHDFFSEIDNWPSWYDPSLRTKGRRYSIPRHPKHGGMGGTMVVRDAEGVVMIELIWG
jgi:hypothetical protein